MGSVRIRAADRRGKALKYVVEISGGHIILGDKVAAITFAERQALELIMAHREAGGKEQLIMDPC